MADFYCYILSDPDNNNQPFYVGKGKGMRAWEHGKGRTLLAKKISDMKSKPIVSLYGSLDEELAFLLERELIDKYGRADQGTGPLLNRTSGGQGCSGKRSPEVAKKLGDIKRGQKFSAEGRKNMSAAAKIRSLSFSPARGPKISASLMGHECSIETRAKIGAKAKERLSDPTKNSMYGRKHSEETREKIRQKALARRKT